MKKQRSIPKEISDIFEELRTELIWLHGRWIIFDQLYGVSPERVEILNETAATYFRITQDVLLDDILIRIGRITDKPSTGKSENLSLGQIIRRLNNEMYPELVSRLEVRLEEIQIMSDTIRKYRNKKLAHHDVSVALKVESLPDLTFGVIRDTLKSIRDFMNECELYFTDSEMAYEAFSMSADGKALINRLKKAIAYDELEKQGVIERGYWRKASKYKTA